MPVLTEHYVERGSTDSGSFVSGVVDKLLHGMCYWHYYWHFCEIVCVIGILVGIFFCGMRCRHYVETGSLLAFMRNLLCYWPNCWHFVWCYWHFCWHSCVYARLDSLYLTFFKRNLIDLFYFSFVVVVAGDEGSLGLFGLRGMGGVGKTTTAIAVAHR